MKTNSATLTSTPAETLHTKTGTSRLAQFGRLLLATMCVSLVTVAAAPRAFAAAPNGSYQFDKATGSVKFDGNSINLPESAIKRIAGVVKGDINIKGGTLELNKNATKKIVNNLSDDLNFNVSVSVTGPESVTLVKEGDLYIGSTAEPIVTSFEGSALGEDFSGELVTNVTAKVNGKTLRVIITFSGSALGSDFSGKLVIIAKR